jgi:hypothetical protein
MTVTHGGWTIIRHNESATLFRNDDPLNDAIAAPQSAGLMGESRVIGGF